MGKQVKTPRFYVDIPTFLHSVGYPEYFTGTGHQSDLLYMNCNSQKVTPLQETWEAQGENQFSYYELHRIGRSTFGRTAYPINFMGFLNHNYGYLTSSNMEDRWVSLYPKRFDAGSNETGKVVELTGLKNIINSGVYNEPNTNGTALKPEWNGTSIFEFEQTTNVWTSFGATITSDNDNSAFPDGIDANGNLSQFIDSETTGIGLGSFVVGRYYDCPNSPDLNLTMSRRFDGIKKQKTIGGKTLANIYYDGPTEWSMHSLEGDSDFSSNVRKYPPFELDSALPSGRGEGPNGEYVEKGKEYYKYRAKSGLGRKGLRSWKLSFSYISEDDMWTAYESSSVAPFTSGDTTNTYTESDVPQDDGRYVSSFDNGHPSESRTNPMLADDSFNFVWNCTLGGTLPFIFQPDHTNNNSDQFAICNFRENTLSVQQVAFNTYKLSITIDEVA